MTVQIAVRLDDALAEQARAAAADTGVTLSEWVRRALQRQALMAKAARARAEEDARGQPHTEEREAELMAARRRRAIAALDEPSGRSSTRARHCSTGWCGWLPAVLEEQVAALHPSRHEAVAAQVRELIGN